ncbi:hypothetical protein AGMMS49982_16380 [Bacteroidia bacterium]|nr:hypothetical protein AGMMS49982_16380 [Bacteroidia bacterium]
MKLYHGTNVEFEWVDIDKCPPLRDFGQGFYTTKFKAHAEERAAEAVRRFQGRATVMAFEFDLEAVAVSNPELRIKRFDRVNEEWAQFVMYHRTRKDDDPPHNYDIVEGPVADDKMFRQFQLFKNKHIGLAKLIRELEYPREPTHQIAFCSECAIGLLLEYNEPPRFKIEHIITELSVALVSEKGYSTIDAQDIIYHSAVFEQLSDISTHLYLKPWQDIYAMIVSELGRGK